MYGGIINPPECAQSLLDEWVLQLSLEAQKCIILHPAFNTVCLDSFSLRLASGKYRTIDKKSYQQTGSEEV